MHVVFDLDGVLLDSESDLAWLDRALGATVSELGLPDTAAARDRLSPWNLDDFEAAAAAFGVDAETLWAVRNRHYTREKVAAIERGEIGPFPDASAVDSLAATREIHVLSNSPTEVVEAYVDAAGHGSSVGARVGRGAEFDALDRLKPARHPFERLVERTGVYDPEEYVYVGDTATDGEFARRVGMAFVRVARDGSADGEARVVDSLDDLQEHLPRRD